jgi:hypothetical protein
MIEKDLCTTATDLNQRLAKFGKMETFDEPLNNFSTKATRAVHKPSASSKLLKFKHE